MTQPFTINAAEANNHANHLWDAGQTGDALQVFERIIQDAPRYALAHLNRGLLLEELGHHDAAIASLDAAIDCQPDLMAAHISKRQILINSNRHSEAIAACQAFLAMAAKHPGIHPHDQQEMTFSLAQLLLSMGQYGQALPLYEMRRSAEYFNPRVIHEPVLNPDAAWLGEQSISGKRLFVWHEQGLGDTLQFCRYLPSLQAQGAQLILESPHPLIVLLAQSFPHVHVVSDVAAKPPAFDVHCPLMSLLLACGTTTTQDIPAQIPYLSSTTSKRQAWGERLRLDLGEPQKLRVGLVWASGQRPDQKQAWTMLALRNIALTKLAGLKQPGIDFISLQKGEAAEQEFKDLQAESWDGPAIHTYSEQLHDFSDTAALIDNLDLVITVDTAVAHLAGALGKPVWILTRFDACWRWLYGQDPHRIDSPWYPTARLFRQPTPGDWDSVVEAVREELGALVALQRDGRGG